MPDILGATNPVPGHDRSTVNRNVPLQPDSTRVQNAPDPSRVVRGDRRDEQQNAGQQAGTKIRYDSNFQVFMRRLRETPGAAESLRSILSGGTTVLSGIQEGTAEELAELIGMLKLTEGELLEFLSGQIKGGSQFGGALFALLRNAYGRAESQTVREDILRFLKSYTDHFDTEHIQGNLLRNLRGMANAMPASWAQQLKDLTAQLERLMARGDRAGSLALLQKSIVPYMGQYVTRSHDMGNARALLSLLTLDMARYENGSEEKLLDAFHQIRGYGTLKRQLADISDQTLMALLKKSHSPGDNLSTRFAEQLAEAASKAMRGGASQEVQQAFQELVRAILINESVYMPLNHYLLPLEMDGRMLFSELWVDPDEENRDQENRGGRREPSIRCLFKMDVEDLGLIDVVLVSQGKDVDLRVSCPEQVLPFAQKIEKGLGTILRQNELTPREVVIRRMDRPLTLTEVFPKIFERKDSLNVTV